MNLARFAQEHPATRGPRCRVCLLPEKARAQIDANPDVEATIVAKWLREQKLAWHEQPEQCAQSIRRHRRLKHGS